MAGKEIYIDVIVPALNEQEAIGLVVEDALSQGVRSVVVVDNNSTDATAQVATDAGAVVLRESVRGYGAACLAGIAYLSRMEVPSEVVVFMDGDHADDASQLDELVAPILSSQADMVIGSRVSGKREVGSLMPQQVFGNALATWLLKVLYGQRFTDLGPFRAIRMESLLLLGMKDLNYGWTVEMQIKAVKAHLRCTEIPANYRKRIGVSKVSGTWQGSILAGYKILKTLFKYA